MGRVYRETKAAVTQDERLGRALAVAAYLLRERSDSRAVNSREGR
jgi:hypothetical protein